MIQKLLRPDLVNRFRQSVRDDGWHAAMTKARRYSKLAVLGWGTSSHTAPSHGGIRYDDQYCARIWRVLAREGAFHLSSPPAVRRTSRHIALIADMNLPQCRKYRVEQLAEFWRSRGVDVTYSHYQDVARGVNSLQTATHLILYRTPHTPTCSMYMYEARRLRLPILYDIDDPLFSVSAYETYQNMDAVDHAMKAHFCAEAPKYLDAMNCADAVSVSTPGLVEHAKLYTQRPVFLRRNFADIATLEAGAAAMRHAPAKVKKDGFTVAFASGSLGHEIDFALIERQLAAFLNSGADRRLVILGHFEKDRLPASIKNKVATYAFTNYADYLERLAQADCAVMPLADDTFNRCKSAVRVLDASAVAIPSIVGSVGDMANVVAHGKTGFIAHTEADWAAFLQKLMADRTACAAMGAAAREDVERRWSGSREECIIDPQLMQWVLE